MAKPSPKHSGDPTLTSIGKAIRAIRKKHGLAQEDLAHATDLDRSYVGGIERGEHNLSVLNLQKIAKELDIKLSELLCQAGL